jgi:hypothetical protein
MVAYKTIFVQIRHHHPAMVAAISIKNEIQEFSEFQIPIPECVSLTKSLRLFCLTWLTNKEVFMLGLILLPKICQDFLCRSNTRFFVCELIKT